MYIPFLRRNRNNDNDNDEDDDDEERYNDEDEYDAKSHRMNSNRFLFLFFGTKKGGGRRRPNGYYFVTTTATKKGIMIPIIIIIIIISMMILLLRYSYINNHKNATTRQQRQQQPSLPKQFQQRPIPHRIFFTFKTNILETKEPKLYYENIQNTIQQYQSLWQKQQPQDITTTMVVSFLDNTACRQQIQLAEPNLVPYFDQEPKGMFKGDLCRTAALYNQGGYYFDVDLRVIQPIRLDPETTFSTVVSSSGVFFQAFLAASPHHIILQRTLQEMLHYYRNKPKLQWFLGLPMGCETLTRAYQSLSMQQRGKVRILQEMNLGGWNNNNYPNLQRQHGKGHLCNYIVHDEIEKQPYFFSRLVGSFRCPYANTTTAQFLWQWLGNE